MRSAAGLAAAAALPLRADPLGMPIGFQTFTVRELLAKDFPGTLRELAAAGFKSLEMCSPAGYVESGFGPLAKYSGTELKKIIGDAGLVCESSHFAPDEFKKNLADRIGWAKQMGLKQMILSSFWLPKGATMDDWKRSADDLNKAAEEIHKAGMQAGFHNHHMEFEKLDGVLIYDELLKRFDPKLVKLQFQVAVISIGYDAAEYFTKHPGRFISMHLADWSSSEKKGVAVGKGIVNWKKVFTAAKTGGVKNYFVEVGKLEDTKASAAYLRGLKA